MITVSQDYKDALAADKRNFYCEAVITMFNGDVLTVTNENIWQGGFRFTEATSDQSSFELGACVGAQLTLILDNSTGAYDSYVFDDASVVASFGLYDTDGTLIDIDGLGGTKIQKGVYFVDEVETNSTFVTLYCLDAMVLLDRDFVDVPITFPATLQTIVQKICDFCNVPYIQGSFTNSTYIVQKKPIDDTLNCRDVLAMVCEIAGCFAKINRLGFLTIGFYNTAFMQTTVPVDGNLDGGSFWSGADNVDGGSFWSFSDLHDAGTIAQNSTPDQRLQSFFSFNRAYKDVILYGIRVMSDSAMYLNGTDAYCVTIQGNLLINAGDEKKVALSLGDKLLYASYRGFEADHLADPTIEAGDTVILTDQFGKDYYSVITQTEFSAGEKQRSQCASESASKSTSNRYQAMSNARLAGVSITNGDGAFSLDKDGNVTANKIYADSGKLAGWTLVNNGFSCIYDTYYSAKLKACANVDDYVFWIGQRDSPNASSYNLLSWFKGNGELHNTEDAPIVGYFKTPNSAGYRTDKFGNFCHLEGREGTSDQWVILDSAGDYAFAVWYETKQTKLYGPLIATGNVYLQAVYGNTYSSAANMFINTDGRVYRSTSSSRRYKKGITEELGELDPTALYDLPVVKFHYKEGYLSEEDERVGKDVIGFIAEDVDELYPVAVRHENGQPEMWESNYIIPAMLKLIQEQKHEIDELRERIEKLERMFAKEATDGDQEQTR